MDAGGEQRQEAGPSQSQIFNRLMYAGEPTGKQIKGALRNLRQEFRTPTPKAIQESGMVEKKLGTG